MNLELLSIIQKKVTEKNYELIDNVLMGIYRRTIGKLQSLACLYNSDSFEGTDAIFRSLFEEKVTIQLILKKESNIRAKAYNLSILVQNIHKFKELAELPEELIEKYLSNRKIDLSIDYMKLHSNEIKEYERLTSRYTGKPDRKGEKWYKSCGNLSNFKDVCTYLGNETETFYQVAYKVWSYDAHGKDVLSYIEQDIEELQLEPKAIDKEEYEGWIIILGTSLFQILSKYYNIPVKKLVTKYNFSAQFYKL